MTQSYIESNQLDFLRLIQQNSFGSFDVYRLAGPYNAKTRARIMSALHGRKIPQAKSGVEAMRAAMFEILKPSGDCLAAREVDAKQKAEIAIQRGKLDQ